MSKRIDDLEEIAALTRPDRACIRRKRRPKCTDTSHVRKLIGGRMQCVNCIRESGRAYNKKWMTKRRRLLGGVSRAKWRMKVADNFLRKFQTIYPDFSAVCEAVGAAREMLAKMLEEPEPP